MSCRLKLWSDNHETWLDLDECLNGFLHYTTLRRKNADTLRLSVYAYVHLHGHVQWLYIFYVSGFGDEAIE